MWRHFALCLLSGCLVLTALADERPFRTDESTDDSLEWYQLVDGEFPPEGSAHYFAAELIAVDHVNRRGELRVCRTDAQRRSHWDLPVVFEMLPYGSIYYRGAPAALRDIPIGTHLHGLFYERDPDTPPPKSEFHHRKSTEAEFTRCFRLEDDFSYYRRQKRAWRIENIDLDENKLTCRGVSTDREISADAKAENADAKPTIFDLTRATRVWKGNGFGTPSDLVEGQIIQLNLTWATLYGPGRCTNIWLDGRSRMLASIQQVNKHDVYLKDRGLAGWIDHVDNQKRIVTMTLFDGGDPLLLSEAFQKGQSLTAVVAEPSLRSYDQVNDRKSGPILEVREIKKEPGSSGIQLVFQPSLLLEGFRPKRIIRVFPAGWNVISIPLEERLWPTRD